MTEETRVSVEFTSTSSSAPALPSSHDPRNPWSTSCYTPALSTGGPTTTRRVLIEWYTYPPGSDLTAKERLARLSHLLKGCHKPATLSTLDSVGIVSNFNIDTIGLIFSVPATANPTKPPVSLYQLLSHRSPRPMPTLEQRIYLASVLSSSLYTFLLARWHHKRFISDSIVFLHDLSPAAPTPTPLPNLARLYIAGFGLSRPEDPAATSFPLFRADEFELYLHPDLDQAGPGQPTPKARAAFDIYSFGLVLAEIGFWGTLRNIVGAKRGPSAAGGGQPLTAQSMRTKVIEKCETDLACWAGKRYRDVTLRCLRAEDVDAGGVGEELSDFFDVVVAELARCCEDWKV